MWLDIQNIFNKSTHSNAAALVQGTLDYCCQLWSPNTPGQIQMLEMVARKFIRQINVLRHLNYWQKLAHRRMYFQKIRRERYMILYIW